MKRCNLCGKSLNGYDTDYIFRARLGYGSINDGDEVAIRLCNYCMDKLVAACEVDPIIESDGGC